MRQPSTVAIISFVIDVMAFSLCYMTAENIHAYWKTEYSVVQNLVILHGYSR